MNASPNRPVIGISIGDLNGIGPELAIRTFSDARVLELCTPVLFVSQKVINFYRKSMAEITLNYQVIGNFSRVNHKQVNVYNCWDEEVAITPGVQNETGGKYAIKSFIAAVDALRNRHIDGLVTAPIHKKNTQLPDFPHAGHTPYLKQVFNMKDVVMLMVSGNFRVGLVTEHIPVSEVSKHITREAILSKLQVLRDTLIRDFGIDKPRIAVLGLNPHAGDEGLIGREEEEIIKPAIKDARHSMLAFGPFSADAFFARGQHKQFDAVLAMYHDQGLIPFKSLAADGGVNYTGGLPVIRTSPDHGTAFDIAGKNRADNESFLAAIYACLDIIRTRRTFEENHKNPLKKLGSVVLAGAADEKIDVE